MVRDARRRAPHHEGIIPTAAAIDSLRHPRVSATALIAGGASEASLEGCQHAGTRDYPSRPAQKGGHLRNASLSGAVGIIRLAGHHFGRAMVLRGRIAPNMMWTE